MVLPAKFEGNGLCSGSGTSTVEPSPDFAERHSLLMARVVAQPRGNVVPVRLINPSTDPVILYKDATLGTITALEECALPQEGESPEVLTVQKSSELPRKTKTELAGLFNLETSTLSEEETTTLMALLDEFQDVYSRGANDLGKTSKVYHKIPTGDARPIKQGSRRLPYHQRREVETNLDAMVKNGVVTPSTSPWSSPIVLVKKKDGTTRFCVDYRKLNDVTRKDAYPLPRIDETLDALGGAAYFSTMDLASGYWQVEVDPSDRDKTAFTTFKGLLEFRVMPFGLTGAPNTFQRLMDSVLSGLQFETCLVYLDDIIVFSSTFDEHIARPRQVLSRLRESGLKVKPSKCHLLRERVPFLGHIISREGVATDPGKVQAVTSWPVPTSKSEVRSFLGLVSHYRRYIKNFAKKLQRPFTSCPHRGRRTPSSGPWTARAPSKDWKASWSKLLFSYIQGSTSSLSWTPMLATSASAPSSHKSKRGRREWSRTPAELSPKRNGITLSPRRRCWLWYSSQSTSVTTCTDADLPPELTMVPSTGWKASRSLGGRSPVG